MTPLEKRIRARIETEGPMPVAEFMAAANNDPEAGYYRRRDPLGRSGDFITAPEISQVFGELIGAWCAVAWQAMGAPGTVILAELGPGRGTLMADALRATAAVPGFHGALDLQLVETSPTLACRQKAALGDHAVTWQETVSGLPDGPLIVVANEFFDVLAVEQYVRRSGRWHRRCVAIDPADGRLCFVAGAAETVPADAPPGASEGAVFETSPASAAIMGEIATRIAVRGGAALIVDYGHAVTAAGETLQAVAGHRYADVLVAPGEADLSAHVDFQALARAARAGGARPFGPVTQGRFLDRLGIGLRMARLIENEPPARQDAVRAGCRRLIDPAAMGRLFKVLAVTDRAAPAPAGFEDDKGTCGDAEE